MSVLSTNLCVEKGTGEKREKERGDRWSQGSIVIPLFELLLVLLMIHICVSSVIDIHIPWVQRKPPETSLPSNLTLILETGLQSSFFISFP